jgi:hypothetical protein
MSDTALVVCALGGMCLAAAMPLLVYALLPHEKLNRVSQHGRFGGFEGRDQATSPTGNSPVPRIASLQGQTG